MSFPTGSKDALIQELNDLKFRLGDAVAMGYSAAAQAVQQRIREIQHIFQRNRPVSGMKDPGGVLDKKWFRDKNLGGQPDRPVKPPAPDTLRSVAPADAAQASLGAGLTPSGFNSLQEVVQNAWSKVSAKPEGATGFAAGEGTGPDIVNALGRILNLYGDPLQSSGPAGMAKLGLFPSKATKMTAGTALREGVAGTRGASGKAFQPVADIVGHVFDKDAPKRGISLMKGVLAPRAQAEGHELVLRSLEPIFANMRGRKNIEATLARFNDVMKTNPNLAQAVGEALHAKGLTIEEFLMEQALR